jgi:hypothetical protein
MAQVPAKTCVVGPNTFGPFPIGSAVSATLVIDRTVAGGLNSLTSATTVDMSIEQSADGVTWTGAAEIGPWTGGAQLDHHGNPLTQNNLGVSGLNPASTQVRLIVTVGGPSSVVLGGGTSTLTVT